MNTVKSAIKKIRGFKQPDTIHPSLFHEIFFSVTIY